MGGKPRHTFSLAHEENSDLNPKKWSAPAGNLPGRGCRQFGKRTCKPNSVVCGHSSRRRVAADTHQRPTRRFRQRSRAALPHRADAERHLALWLRFPPYLVLLRVGFTLASAVTVGAVRSYRTISPLPRRWSFRNGERRRQAGPTRVLRLQGGPWPEGQGVAEAVSFLWHWPSMGFQAHVPDVIRHTALRSSDFPPPVNFACANPPAATAQSSCQSLVYRQSGLTGCCSGLTPSLAFPRVPSSPDSADLKHSQRQSLGNYAVSKFWRQISRCRQVFAHLKESPDRSLPANNIQ